jgi:DNA-binding NarL/FixJ family response regulator
MEEKITVALVEDHPLFRTGLREAIRADSRFEIIAEAANGDAALETIAGTKPDLAVVDINLPRMSGLDLAAALKRRRIPTRIVILTVSKEERLFNRALNLDIRGYVLKESAESEILDCIAAVADGKSYVSSSLSDFLLRRHDRVEVLSSRSPGVEDLTLAERRVLKRVAAGKTTKEIAAEFFISPRTVESHRSNICGKLNLTGSNPLLQFALEHRDALSHLE